MVLLKIQFDNLLMFRQKRFERISKSSVSSVIGLYASRCATLQSLHKPSLSIFRYYEKQRMQKLHIDCQLYASQYGLMFYSEMLQQLSRSRSNEDVFHFFCCLYGKIYIMNI